MSAVPSAPEARSRKKSHISNVPMRKMHAMDGERRGGRSAVDEMQSMMKKKKRRRRSPLCDEAPAWSRAKRTHPVRRKLLSGVLRASRVHAVCEVIYIHFACVYGEHDPQS